MCQPTSASRSRTRPKAPKLRASNRVTKKRSAILGRRNPVQRGLACSREGVFRTDSIEVNGECKVRLAFRRSYYSMKQAVAGAICPLKAVPCLKIFLGKQ